MITCIVCVFGLILVTGASTIYELKLEGKIINGVTASKNQFPYVAFLKIYLLSESNEVTTRQCVGSIISNIYILTAAHCVLE